MAWVRLIPTAPALIDRRNTVVGGSFYSGLKMCRGREVEKERVYVLEMEKVRQRERERQR